MSIPQLKGRKNPHRPTCYEHGFWSGNHGRVTVDIGGEWHCHLDQPLTAPGTTIFSVPVSRCPFCSCKLEPIPEKKR